MYGWSNDENLSHDSCQNYIRNDYARIKIRVDGSSYLKRLQSLKHGDADKFAIIGGTLGLFTGFSFIVIFELIYWIIVTIKKVIVLLTNNKSTNSNEDVQQPSLEEKLTKEISMSQERILKLENMIENLMKEVQNPQLKKDLVIVDMQESSEPAKNVQQPPQIEKLTQEISISKERIFNQESGQSEGKGKPKDVQNPQLKKELVIVDMQES